MNVKLTEAAWIGDHQGCKEAKQQGATDFNGMLYRAAQGGHRDLCELAKSWGATDFDWMLNGAARGGHRDLCELAKSWGATDFDWMLHWAARGGHRDLGELAKSWGATDFDGMLHWAAQTGHRDLCELAKYWIACADHPCLPAAVSLFGLLLITDDYFRLSIAASSKQVRWVNIMTQLPLELQVVICLRQHNRGGCILRQKIDEGGRWLFPDSC
jgi:hypothetical protein